MSMKHIFICILFNCSWLSLNAQIVVDTAQIASEIKEIRTKEDAEKYLKQIWEDDQNYRGPLTNDTIDIINLFKTSYYINRFGYPTEFGELSVMPWHVHRHTDNVELRRITLPIMWEAYKKKLVEENHIKHSISSTSWCLEDGFYVEKTPLNMLIEEYNLTLSRVIPIKKMVKCLEGQLPPIDLVKRQEWKAKDTKNTYDINGESYEMIFKGHSVEFFSDQAGSMYYRTLFRTTGQLRKLKLTEPNVYVFEDCEKDRLVIEGNSLKYMHGTRLVQEYWAVEDFK